LAALTFTKRNHRTNVVRAPRLPLSLGAFMNALASPAG
jgi:hypothetical protein